MKYIFLVFLLATAGFTGSTQELYVKEVSLYRTMNDNPVRDSIECTIIVHPDKMQIIRELDTGTLILGKPLDRKSLDRGSYYDGNLAVSGADKYMILYEKSATGSIISISVSNFRSMIIFLIYTKPKFQT